MVLIRRITAYKIALYFFTILFALTLNFSLPRIAPGDPLDYLFGPQVTSLSEEERSEVLHEFGLDGSIYEQYWRYLVGILYGDLGTSIQYSEDVTVVLLEKLPWTLLLVGSSLAITTVIGTLIGILSAWKRGRTSFGVLISMLALDSIPGFWVGMILISIFAVYFGWFPTFGVTALSFENDSDVLNIETLKRLVLPITTLTLASIGGVYLLARSTMITTLGENYLFMAEAKGVSEWGLIFHHALRNVILPIYSQFAISFGAIVSGAVVVETIFSYPGLGSLIYESVLIRDYPLMQGAFLLVAVFAIVANIIADLTYPLLDPRVRRSNNER
jgi:peptide/nickel transport system permease protein